jgi:hypothetical protein
MMMKMRSLEISGMMKMMILTRMKIWTVMKTRRERGAWKKPPLSPGCS